MRKLAKDLGIDLAAVAGSGAGGIITRDDVDAARCRARAGAAPAGAAAGAAAAGAGRRRGGERETRIPIKGVRKMTAQAMVASAFTAPHVTEFVTVDVTRTMKLVERLQAATASSATSRSRRCWCVAKALLIAVRRNPEINATWDEAAQEIVVKHYVNLGIAAATPRGLIVPNIKDADAMSLRAARRGHRRADRDRP